jgi:hypothetical protein
MSGTVRVWDGRDASQVAAECQVDNCQIERVLWNAHDPFTLFFSTNTGRVHLRDIRKFVADDVCTIRPAAQVRDDVAVTGTLSWTFNSSIVDSSGKFLKSNGPVQVSINVPQILVCS